MLRQSTGVRDPLLFPPEKIKKMSAAAEKAEKRPRRLIHFVKEHNSKMTTADIIREAKTAPLSEFFEWDEERTTSFLFWAAMKLRERFSKVISIVRCRKARDRDCEWESELDTHIDRDGNNVFHRLALYNRISLIYALEEDRGGIWWETLKRSLLGMRNNTGNMPHHYAFAPGYAAPSGAIHKRLVKALTDCGADLNATNNEGRTAYLISSRRHPELVPDNEIVDMLKANIEIANTLMIRLDKIKK